MPKVCRTCKEMKITEEFPKNTSYKLGRSSECKTCANIKAKKYRDPTKKAMWKYGISEDLAKIYISITEWAICGNPQVPGKLMCIDHCHTTGKLRGGLCDFCNKGLGQFRDNKELLQRAIQYLEKYERV